MFQEQLDKTWRQLRVAEARVTELVTMVEDRDETLVSVRRENADLQDQLHRLRTRNAELERARPPRDPYDG